LGQQIKSTSTLFAVERTVKMAYIQEKIKGKKIVSFKFKATSQERPWGRSKMSAENLNTIAHIALLAIATVTFVTRHPKLARSRKRCSRCA